MHTQLLNTDGEHKGEEEPNIFETLTEEARFKSAKPSYTKGSYIISSGGSGYNGGGQKPKNYETRQHQQPTKMFFCEEINCLRTFTDTTKKHRHKQSFPGRHWGCQNTLTHDNAMTFRTEEKYLRHLEDYHNPQITAEWEARRAAAAGTAASTSAGTAAVDIAAEICAELVAEIAADETAANVTAAVTAASTAATAELNKKIKDMEDQKKAAEALREAERMAWKERIQELESAATSAAANEEAAKHLKAKLQAYQERAAPRNNVLRHLHDDLGDLINQEESAETDT